MMALEVFVVIKLPTTGPFWLMLSSSWIYVSPAVLFLPVTSFLIENSSNSTVDFHFYSPWQLHLPNGQGIPQTLNVQLLECCRNKLLLSADCRQLTVANLIVFLRGKKTTNYLPMCLCEWELWKANWTDTQQTHNKALEKLWKVRNYGK